MIKTLKNSLKFICIVVIYVFATSVFWEIWNLTLNEYANCKYIFLSMGAILGIAVIRFCLKNKYSKENTKNFSVKYILLSLLIGLSLNFFIGGIFDYILFKSETSDIEFPNVFSVSYLILVAPIAEEYIFRKCSVNLFGSEVSDKVFAVLLSSLLFSAVHNITDISTIMITFSSAIIFSIIYIKSRKILYPIISHSMFNIISIIDAMGEFSTFSNLYIILFFGLVLSVSLILFLFKKNAN